MKNKIAVVSGASRGIGKAIVERLLTEKYIVYAIDIDKPDNELMNNSGFYFSKVDITSEVEVKDFFKSLKGIDVLVNNAGIIKDNMIWKMSLQDFEDVISVNLKGTWLMCREASLLMKNKGFGRIINISSRAWLGNRGQSNYSSSKAGVIGLTRVLALELGKYNVLVNAIAPGLIDTPLTRKLEKSVLQQLIEAQPTKAMGTPDDIARVVSFLSAEETRFITGQVIYVDGGKSIGAGI